MERRPGRHVTVRASLATRCWPACFNFGLRCFFGSSAGGAAAAAASAAAAALAAAFCLSVGIAPSASTSSSRGAACIHGPHKFATRSNNAMPNEPAMPRQFCPEWWGLTTWLDAVLHHANNPYLINLARRDRGANWATRTPHRPVGLRMDNTSFRGSAADPGHSTHLRLHKSERRDTPYRRHAVEHCLSPRRGARRRIRTCSRSISILTTLTSCARC